MDLVHSIPTKTKFELEVLSASYNPWYQITVLRAPMLANLSLRSIVIIIFPTVEILSAWLASTAPQTDGTRVLNTHPSLPLSLTSFVTKPQPAHPKRKK